MRGIAKRGRARGRRRTVWRKGRHAQHLRLRVLLPDLRARTVFSMSAVLSCVDITKRGGKGKGRVMVNSCDNTRILFRSIFLSQPLPPLVPQYTALQVERARIQVGKDYDGQRHGGAGRAWRAQRRLVQAQPVCQRVLVPDQNTS